MAADYLTPEQPAAKAAFANELVNQEALLPTAIEWIGDNLQPGDVFPNEKLEAWAAAAGYTRTPMEA